LKIELCFIMFTLFSVCYASESLFPEGHLKPFGFHRPPTVLLDEFTLENAPKPAEFYENYFKAMKPAIFRGGLVNTDVFKHWTNDYLKEHYGDLEMRVLRLDEKKHDGMLAPLGEKYYGRDTIRHFVDHFQSEESNSYMVSELPAQMYKEFPVLPSIGACGEFTRNFIEINIWWNKGGSSSLLHEDSYNQLNCQLIGSKQWKLAEPQYTKWVYEQDEYGKAADGGASLFDPMAVDLIKYPDIVKVPWTNVTLHAGDCIFFPKRYYHQVNSLGNNSLSVVIQFGVDNDKENSVDQSFEDNTLDVSDCLESTDYKTPRLLNEFDVMWKWYGEGYMNFGQTSFVHARENLLMELNKCDGKCNFKEFQTICEHRANWWCNSTRVFNSLDTNKDGLITTDEGNTATWDQLRVYVKEISDFESINSVFLEATLIPRTNVEHFLHMALGKAENLKRETWLKVYQRLRGTSFMGDRIFTRLVGSSEINEVRSESIT
uniref:JmjC domain-containing protein n=1 Tax=Ciona intestinalis TaxID=7719 RepID=H2Y346_CIOIN